MDVIKELGLESVVYNVWNELRGDFDKAILLKDLRAAIEKLPVVYSDPENATWWGNECEKDDTHKARLIGVEKLVKEPVRVEKNFLKEDPDNYFKSIEVPKEFNGKPFKVVFEEVIE